MDALIETFPHLIESYTNGILEHPGGTHQDNYADERQLRYILI